MAARTAALQTLIPCERAVEVTISRKSPDACGEASLPNLRLGLLALPPTATIPFRHLGASPSR
jgi:hypothetical protein